MGNVALRNALEDYKIVYMPYRNFAERTRIEYQNDLESFIQFLGKVGIDEVKELNVPIIEKYIAHLEQKGFASLTRKRKVVAIRSFLLFLFQDNYIAADISKKVIPPFAEGKTPRILTQTECARIRATCAASPRDRAIFELLLQTGIKLSELVNLTLDDLELGEYKRRFLRIKAGRGKKEREIPLNSKAYGALSSYLKYRKGTASERIFLNRFDKPLGERGVQKIIRKYLRKAKIEHGSIHTLRHTFGFHHTSKGISLKALQEAMGHKDERSTRIYVSLVREVRQNIGDNPI